MRPISRTAVGAATAAVLAVTAVGPSTAQPADGAPGAGKRPLVGSEAAGKQPTAPVTVTLVTGDRILVSTDTAGRTAATAMPRADGSQPLVQTRQSGKDLYVYPEGAVRALAAGKVDPELFNVTGLVRQGYDDAHTKKLPLIAVYDASVNVARSAPPAPRGADRSLVLGSIGAVALAADKEQAAAFWADVTGTDARARSVSGGLKKLWLDGKVQANLERSTKQVAATAAWAPGTTARAPRSPSSTPEPTWTTPTWRAGSRRRRTSPTPTPTPTGRATAPTPSPPSAAPAPRAAAPRRGSPPAPNCSAARSSTTGATAWIRGSSRAWSGPSRPRPTWSP